MRVLFAAKQTGSGCARKERDRLDAIPSVEPERINSECAEISVAIGTANGVITQAGVGAHSVGPVVPNFGAQAEIIARTVVDSQRDFPIVSAVEAGNRLTKCIDLIQVRPIDADPLWIGEPLTADSGGPAIVKIVK